MTIADDYFAETGETVGQAAKRLHAEGINVERASHMIGYSTSSDLRKYLRRRGMHCPWPLKPVPVQGKPPRKVTDEMIERYAELRLSGLPACDAIERAGVSRSTIHVALRRRRPDLRARMIERGVMHEWKQSAP